MVKSMYAGVAGLRAHQTKMDVIGNNIANVNTYGYKAARITFKDQFYQTRTVSANPSMAYGGSNPNQIGYGTSIAAIAKAFTTGGISPTDSPFDSMINGNGFYIVGPKDPGDQGVVPAPNQTTGGFEGIAADDIKGMNLTRMGEFTFDEEGYLVDANKNYVYGFRVTNYDSSTNEGPVPNNLAEFSDEKTATDPAKLFRIRLPQEEVTPVGGTTTKVSKVLSSLTIGADGIITGIDENKELCYVGKIALANVPNPNALEATENSYYVARNNTGKVEAYAPGSGTTGLLISGALELSNVDLAKEFTEMITTQRGFQANTRVITVTDEMLNELVNLKR